MSTSRGQLSPLPLNIHFGDSAHEYALRREQVLRQVKHLHHLQRNIMVGSYSQSCGMPIESDPSSSLGLSAITVYSLEDEWKYCYVSESFRDILGYEFEEIVGQRMDSIWHPDEYALTRQVRERAISVEQTACVAYLRLRHKLGGYVNICCSFSIAYDKIVGIFTLAENGPMTLHHARTAKAVVEITPSDGLSSSHSQRAWSHSLSRPGSPSQSPTGGSLSPRLQSLDGRSASWEPPAARTPRTIFIIDRFTDSATVHFISNDIIVKGASLPSHSFYSIVRPSHRAEARRWLDAAKNWSPVQKSAARSGGHGFTTFDVLKIPDLPPTGDRFPRGTDAGERHMPGQEFIPVEAVFTASSDGVVCVLERLPPRPPGAEGMEATMGGKVDPRLLHTPRQIGSSHSHASSFTAVGTGGITMSRQSTLIDSRNTSPSIKSESPR